MKIGIIGAGYIGRAITDLAISAGHAVMVSNSRKPDTLASMVAFTGATAGTASEAAAFGDIVVLAVPFTARNSLPADALSGKIVVDANNYYPHRDGHIPELVEHQATTSEIIAACLPSSRIVKAFNAILANDLPRDAKPKGASGRRALPIASDDSDAKEIVAAFQDDLGFDVVDAGRLADSWRFERAKPGYCIALDKAGMERALVAAERNVEVEDGSWRGK